MLHTFLVAGNAESVYSKGLGLEEVSFIVLQIPASVLRGIIVKWALRHPPRQLD